MLSETTFGAILAYSPYGKSDVSKGSQGVRTKIKNADVPTIALAVQRLIERMPELDRGQFFDAETVLVPAPRSSPLLSSGAVWPSRTICDGLLRAGIGARTAPLLVRIRSVPKSSFAPIRQRPKPEDHYRSISVARDLYPPQRITVVDDVVTRGATLLACVARLREAYPVAAVNAFALIRSVSYDPVDRVSIDEVAQIVAPVVGQIRYVDGELFRTP